jgi:hypothetical protein
VQKLVGFAEKNGGENASTIELAIYETDIVCEGVVEILSDSFGFLRSSEVNYSANRFSGLSHCTQADVVALRDAASGLKPPGFLCLELANFFFCARFSKSHHASHLSFQVAYMTIAIRSSSPKR